MARAYTILQYRDRLKVLKKDLNRAIQKPFRKGQKTMQSALMAEYWKSDFGARIWKWRQRKFGVKGGPSVKLGGGRRRKLARWSGSEGAWVAPITVKGMAASMEDGGRLRRHVFWGRGSREPGMVVPAHRVFDRVVEKNFDKTVDEMSKGFWKFVDGTVFP